MLCTCAFDTSATYHNLKADCGSGLQQEPEILQLLASLFSALPDAAPSADLQGYLIMAAVHLLEKLQLDRDGFGPSQESQVCKPPVKGFRLCCT